MLFRSLLFITSFYATAASSAAPPAAPVPDLLPPAAPWHGKSEQLIVPAADRLATPAEQSDFQSSPTYAQTLDYLRTLAASSKLLSLHTFGKSTQGRDLVYVLAKKPGAKKPVVMIQAGIHSGEIDGKDAGLAVARYRPARP